ncbi:MAG: hypothetical protein KY469_07295 [Actinobacteria bacterium]|nr:hypothetical protein [Actinomycetota bacterium]
MGEPSTSALGTTQDPGWRPALSGLLLLFVPFVHLVRMRALRKDDASTPSITQLRSVFLSFGASNALFLVVLLFIFPSDEPAQASTGAVAAGVVGLGIVALGGVWWARRLPLDCSGASELARSYSTWMFLGIAFAESAALFGFVGSFLVEALWPYLIGLVLAAIGLASIAPTRGDIERREATLRASGCDRSLAAAIYGQAE